MFMAVSTGTLAPMANVAAIAREAALHKLRVLVLEQTDVCSGTSAWSSRLIHGGLRYLEYAELPLVYESLGERERLFRTAPHLVEPLGLYIPIYQSGRRPRWQIKAGMALYDILSFKKSVAAHEMLSVAQLSEALPALNADGLVGAAYYYDGQVTFPERLVVENLKCAIEQGARLMTHTRVTDLLVSKRKIRGVRFCDRSGETGEALAAVVVNAAGPWVDRVLGNVSQRPLIGGTKGSHLIVDPFPGAPDSALYVEAQADGRPFFIIPWNGFLLIGTTDQRYQGDPGEAAISDEEFRYLVSETQRVFPGIDIAERVLYTHSGVRSLPFKSGGKEGAITRRHIVKHHRQARGLYSIVGGKLTTHRALAEDVMVRVGRRLGLRDTRSPTRERLLPGAASSEERDELIGDIAGRLGHAQARRLYTIYGRGAAAIDSLAGSDPQLAEEICPHTKTLAAEIIHALESEWAGTLIDILQRRTMSGLGRDFGLAAAKTSAETLARLSVWSPSEADEALADYRAYASRFRARTGSRAMAT